MKKILLMISILTLLFVMGCAKSGTASPDGTCTIPTDTTGSFACTGS